MSGLHFIDDPNIAGRRIWRRPGAEAWISGFVAVFFAGITLAMVAILLLSLRKPDTVILAGGSMAISIAALLSVSVWRDFLGKRGAFIALTSSEVILRLPAYRSLIQKPPACRETVPLDDVAGVETRLEFYGATGYMRQRSYRLVRRQRPAIFLFEDRAVGTTMASESMWQVADEIARCAGVVMTDIGTVKGRSGVLGAWFASAPPWSTASLSETRRVALQRRAALFVSVLTSAATLVWIVPMIMRLFRR